MSYGDQSGPALPITRVGRRAVWDFVQLPASGVMFVLLGEQLPQLVTGAARVVREAGHHEPIWLVVYVVAITLALAVLRFIWVWTSLRFTLFRAALKGLNPYVPSWRLIAAASFAGVRGTITLAGVLTLPLTMNDGSAFPARALAILLAPRLIIVSLGAASFSRPLLLKGLECPPEPSQQEEEDQARIAP